MSALSSLMIGHGGHRGIASLLMAPISSLQVTIDPYICNGMDGRRFDAKQAPRIVRNLHAVIVELSEYSTSRGAAAGSEFNVLEAAAHMDIPCVLVVNSCWHAELTNYLKNPAIASAIRLVVISTAVTERGETDLLDGFPKAKALRYRPQTTIEIAREIKQLAEMYANTTLEAPTQKTIGRILPPYAVD